jgi:hypothetical protein
MISTQKDCNKSHASHSGNTIGQDSDKSPDFALFFLAVNRFLRNTFQTLKPFPDLLPHNDESKVLP